MMSRAKKYFTRYAYAAGKGLYAFTLGQKSAAHRSLIYKICEFYGYDPDRPASVFPILDESKVVSADTDIKVVEPAPRDGNVTLFELLIILKLVRMRAPKTIFEIGTFDGRTTLNMAANSGADTKLYTLDLPASGLETHKLPLSDADRVYVNKASSGARFVGSAQAPKITQLLGDSATFDYTPYHNSMDFIFLDGAHTYEYVISDTENGMKMLRGGKGIILWHDYGRDIGATYALHDLFRKDKRFSKLVAVEGTALALCIFD